MTWSVLVIFFCSFVCQTVFIFFGNTTSAKGGIGLKNSQSRTIARCINWTQYAVDPFIYAIRNKEFRQAYKDVFYPVTNLYRRISEISMSTKNTYITKNSKNSGSSGGVWSAKNGSTTWRENYFHTIDCTNHIFVVTLAMSAKMKNTTQYHAWVTFSNDLK